MSYRIDLAPKVEKQMAAMPMADRRRMMARVDALADNPRPAGALKMEGLRNVWRLRVGDWRVIYEIHDVVLVVLVVRVGHRREVYRHRG
jgi:mRNA interferase RelE/StbE